MITALDYIVVALILLTVPAANVFFAVYVPTTRWRATLSGRALLVKSASTLLLVDLALMVRVIDPPEIVTAVMRVVVFTLICVGVNMMCWALLREKGPLLRARYRAWRTRPPMPSERL